MCKREGNLYNFIQGIKQYMCHTEGDIKLSSKSYNIFLKNPSLICKYFNAKGTLHAV